MAKQYAVYHVEKGSVSSGGIGNHIDRAPGEEHTYPHADLEKLHLNEHIEVNSHCNKVLSQAISDRITEGYSARNKAGELKEIRKDAVKFQTHIMSGTHEQMKIIENDPQLRKDWISKNLEFLKKEYGEKNIVRFNVHRDEKTMHIHAVTVPLTDDGRLSAKDIMGNRKAMQERQDRYHDEMKSFGLERGEKSTGIKHENAREYYARMEKALDVGNSKAPEDIKKAVLGVQIGIDKEKTIENLKAEISAQKTAVQALKNDADIQKRRSDQVNERKKIAERERNNLAEAVKKKDEEIKEIIKKANQTIRNVALSDKFREQIVEQERKKTFEKIKNTINNSPGLVDINAIDKIIREKMAELEPNKNPWTTLTKHFGDDAENKIQLMAMKRNEELQNQEKSQERKQNRGFSR
ncbi:MobV family relaxase [Chryseobacterium sp.]|uniref:MobV family relaxase n=1 Tax=Chryseobacterium sp. TaxID=1871047 RepID=UPI002FC9637B